MACVGGQGHGERRRAGRFAGPPRALAGYSAPAWMGLFLPARTPADVQAKLSAAVAAAMASPAMQSQIAALAAEPSYMNGPNFKRFIDGESSKWAKVIERVSSPAK